MIPANGLLILPEASSGCSCSYNFQTSLALVPSAGKRYQWHIFEGGWSGDPVVRLGINLGAPGDRRDGKGAAWLGLPRPSVRGAYPAPVSILMKDRQWYNTDAGRIDIKGTGMPWLYASGVEGSGKIEVRLWVTPVLVPPCEKPPAIDGKLDDACWENARPIPFPEDAHLQEPETHFLMRRDDRNVYLGFRAKAVVRNGVPLPFKAEQKGLTADYYKDDCLQILLSDRAAETSIHLGLTCGGACQAGLNRIRERKYDGKWKGVWKRAAQKGEKEWTAEVAVSLRTLKEAGIDQKDLHVNLKARNQSKEGRSRLLLRRHRGSFPRTGSLVPAVLKPAVTAARLFTVRLHFTEPENVSAGERVCDVKLQGKTVLENLDVLKESGGRNKALVKEFKNVAAGDAVIVELIQKSAKPPLLCALELVYSTPSQQ
jgi:hypothetical protein